jgi:hypothetical protein
MERDSSKSFPEIFKDQYDLKGLYRFLNNEKVEVPSFIESYRKGLITWVLAQKKDTPFYLFQDSTFGKYAGRKVDLGYLETGTDNGVLIHNGILTTSDFEPLGLGVQQFIRGRPVKENVANMVKNIKEPLVHLSKKRATNG